MRHTFVGQILGDPLGLFVESWRTQFIIYGTTLLVALAIALVADLRFGMPINEVIELTIFSTLALLVLVPMLISMSRLKASRWHHVTGTARQKDETDRGRPKFDSRT